MKTVKTVMHDHNVIKEQTFLFTSNNKLGLIHLHFFKNKKITAILNSLRLVMQS